MRSTIRMCNFPSDVPRLCCFSPRLKMASSNWCDKSPVLIKWVGDVHGKGVGRRCPCEKGHSFLIVPWKYNKSFASFTCGRPEHPKCIHDLISPLLHTLRSGPSHSCIAVFDLGSFYVGFLSCSVLFYPQWVFLPAVSFSLVVNGSRLPKSVVFGLPMVVVLIIVIILSWNTLKE